MEWITTGGGPLIAVPEAVLGAWQGADDEGDEDAGDYGRACAVDEYAAPIDVAGTPALVLGDDPAPTTFLPQCSLLVRRSAADSAEAALAAVDRALMEAAWAEQPAWNVPGPVLLFDAAYAAADLTDSLRLDLAPGRYRVESAYVEPDEHTWLVLIRLTKSVTDFIEIRLTGALPVDRDDIEDALNEALTGIGEVSGAGSGAFGAHLDVDIDPEAERDEAVDRVLGVLSRLGLAGMARIRPGDGSEWIEVGAA
ncbi:Imm21 family immunity protein [Streptomyces sp. NPDC057136]|uniref:Imm21 family immunity protein n=1 Tax=Streptomyces sp. NPDC057136 TaxID=3346029 RepID=UPI003626DEBE